jgi:3-isopropylmalate/(R)-2-methylmalate dehydratase small subunit
MKAFRSLTAGAVVLDRPDVDTDQIIPKQFLKRIERTGYGQFLFNDWRFLPDGTPNPDFVLNQPVYKGATVLLAGRNFGCGSSREHAPWALGDYGFRAVIAPSFADIFRNNCSKIGLLAVELPSESVRALMDAVLDDPTTEIVVDLDALRVSAPAVDERFEMDPYTRWRLLEGLDDISLTLAHEAAIDAFERSRPARLPSLS